MSNQVQFNAFNFKSSQVRVITDPNQEFWFCGSDVCYILGYKNAPDALAKHCKQGGIAKRYTPTQSGEQEMIFINEPNLYRLIIKSRKPEAEPFEAWVFEEVLPQIRKTGKYSVQQQNLPLARQERMMTVRLPESDLKDIAWLWFAADKMQKFIDSLQPALQILGSNLYGTAYSYQKEYGDLIQFIGPMIYKLTKDVDFSDRPTPIKALEQAIAQPKSKRLAKF